MAVPVRHISSSRCKLDRGTQHIPTSTPTEFQGDPLEKGARIIQIAYRSGNSSAQLFWVFPPRWWAVGYSL